MSSYTVPMILNWLKDSCVRYHQGRLPGPLSGGIRLLERSSEPLRPNVFTWVSRKR